MTATMEEEVQRLREEQARVKEWSVSEEVRTAYGRIERLDRLSHEVMGVRRARVSPATFALIQQLVWDGEREALLRKESRRARGEEEPMPRLPRLPIIALIVDASVREGVVACDGAEGVTEIEV